MQEDKLNVRRGFKIAKKRSKKQRKKGKIYPPECKVQRIARGGKKVLNEQCKEIEENNRMRTAKDLLKKIRDIKGAFHARMGTIKDRSYRDLTERKEIKKRQQCCFPCT